MRPTRPTTPNSLVPATVTFAASGKGLNNRNVVTRSGCVVPPGRCHSLGTAATQRSPVMRKSDVTTDPTAAGPSSSSTNPGASPRRTIEATSSAAAPGPERLSRIPSGVSLGIGLGSVISAPTSVSLAIMMYASRTAPAFIHGQYQTLPSAPAMSSMAAAPVNDGLSGAGGRGRVIAAATSAPAARNKSRRLTAAAFPATTRRRAPQRAPVR